MRARSGTANRVAAICVTALTTASVLGFGALSSSAAHAQSSLTTLVGRATAGTPTFTARCDYNNTPAIGDTITVSAESIARMSDGSYVIFDRGANCIHRLAGGNLTTIAGNGTVGNPIDGLATTTPIRSVSGLAVASDGTIFFSDSDNNVIRKFTIGGNVSTVAGNATAGYVSTGYDNTISLAAARFNNPFGLALDSAGNLFVAEWRGRCVKRIDNAVVGATGVTRIAGYCATDGGGLPGGVFNDNVAAQDAVFDQLPALAFDTAGNLYIAEAVNRRIRKVTAGANNLIDPTDLTTTIAGTGALGSSGDGGLATSAVFSTVLGLAADAGGSVHFGDTDTHRIRRVHAAGGISTSIGTGSAGYGADTTGNLTALAVSRPNGFVIDPDGSIVFADQDNFRIRRITLDATADAFSFNALTNVPINTAITSNIVVPTGFDSPASVQVANGSYSIGCSGTFTSNAGTINPGQSVCVRVTSANAGNTTTTATLTVGSVAANFAVTTQTVTLTGTITAISAGTQSTCIVIDGGVQCWGRNTNLVLGNGNSDFTFISAVPVQAIPAGSGATAVSVGEVHVCAVVAGGVKCWGVGLAGRLGNGSTFESASPVDVVGLGAGSGVTQVGVGSAHSCAVANGAAFCWGGGFSGQLGNGSTANSLVPVAVNAPGNSGVTWLATGEVHTCLMISGAPYCTGSGLANLQANNVSVNSVSASTLAGLNFAAEISANSNGEFSCFRNLGHGGIICYGLNDNGRLGNGTNTGSALATVVSDFSTTVSAGVNHACAIVDGGLFCWGSNEFGRAGLPLNTVYLNANPLPAYPSGSGVTHIAAGETHTCAVVNGRVRCWGSNVFARLGVFYDVNLSLTKSGSGTGLVTSSVGGINCGTACNSVAPFAINVNTSVTLSALADAGMSFTGWSGVTCSEGQTSATCTFTAGGNPGAANAATASFSNVATTCLVGTFSATGLSPCTQAAAGFYVPTAGAMAQTPCAAGSYSNVTGAAICTLASAGSFVAASGSSTQILCPTGSYSSVPGATSCTPASAGFYVAVTGATEQTACNAGTYNPTTGGASAAACVPASAGNFVELPGAASQTPCAAGSFSNVVGAQSCTQASAGSFVANAGSSTQTFCPTGSYSAAQGATSCTPASAGFYVAVTGATDQTACNAGTYNPTTGGSSAAACIPASAGNFVDVSGAASQTPCAAGSFSNVVGAQTCTLASQGNFVANTGSSSQTPCAVGTYSQTQGSTACTPASAGFYVALTGAFEQTACLAGTFNPTAGGTSAAACIQASAGNFVELPGAASQTPCAAGRFSNVAGATVCTEASAGSFVANVGSSTQTPCAVGTYSALPGSTSCTPAAIGFYVDTTGATVQTACAMGLTTAATGSTSATACVASSITYNLVLEGTQETPPNASTGTGSGTAVVDTVNNTITLNVVFSGITLSDAHLHGPAVRGVAAGVKIPVSDLTSPITQTLTYLEADEAAILAGNWYLNLHTPTFGGGELRAQLDNLGGTNKTLTVARNGTGTGTVSGTGINCGADCTETVAHNTSVTVTATPDAGATFTGWSGGGCTGTGTCTVTMNLSKTVTATFAINLNLTGVFSRKTHGAAGDFDLQLVTGIPITGTVTIDPRSCSSTHTVVFVFDGIVNVAGTVTVTDPNAQPIGTPVVPVVTGTGRNEVSVVVTGIPNGSRATFTLNGVQSALTVNASAAFFVGDSNADKKVDSVDLSAIKSRSGVTVTSSNFLFDANCSGTVTAAEISSTKARSGNTLP